MMSDEEFVEFYHNIISDEITLIPEAMNRACLDKVRQAYYRSTINSGTSDINFDSSGMRCAYVYQYAPCFTSIVACHFKKILEEGNSVLEDLLKQQNTISICCLGGGPGTEIVAFSKALENFMKVNLLTKPLEINAVIVDIESGWKTTAEKVIQQLSNLLQSSPLTVSLHFITGNLREPFSENIQHAIAKSDIITMVKLLSAMHGTDCREAIPRTLKDIILLMKEDALLFYMDSSGYNRPMQIKCMVLFDMIPIYGPMDSNSYEMSLLSRLHVHFSLAYKCYGRTCTLSSKNYICAWQKNDVFA